MSRFTQTLGWFRVVIYSMFLINKFKILLITRFGNLTVSKIGIQWKMMKSQYSNSVVYTGTYIFLQSSAQPELWPFSFVQWQCLQDVPQSSELCVFLGQITSDCVLLHRLWHFYGATLNSVDVSNSFTCTWYEWEWIL